MNKTIKKTFIIIGSVVGGIAALFLLLYAVLAIIGCAMYGEARSVREYVCIIPDLGSGFTPQGVAYSSERDLYIQTGYDSDDTTMLYIVKGKEYRRVPLTYGNGDPVKGHAGGVACTQDKVYISNGNVLLAFSLEKLIKADGAVAVEQIVAVDNSASFCFSDDEYLYVGEFYRAGNYETEVSHHYTTPSGDENKAVVSCYKLDSTGSMTYDGEQPYPLYCISVTGLVQGFAVCDGVFALSRSYGLKNSSLDYHGAPKDSGTTISVEFKYNGAAEKKDVPLYYLDSSTLVKTLTLPAFSEDLTVADGRIVATNEASANKYVVGKLFGANKVYSYPLYKAE